MRSVTLGLGISLDGYIARLDGNVDFLFMPKDLYMAPFFSTVDAAIMSRKTYAAALKMGGSMAGSNMKSYVMSRTLPTGERDGAISPTHRLAHLSKNPANRPESTFG
jgi:dihydrofolate reductase